MKFRDKLTRRNGMALGSIAASISTLLAFPTQVQASILNENVSFNEDTTVLVDTPVKENGQTIPSAIASTVAGKTYTITIQPGKWLSFMSAEANTALKQYGFVVEKDAGLNIDGNVKVFLNDNNVSQLRAIRNMGGTYKFNGAVDITVTAIKNNSQTYLIGSWAGGSTLFSGDFKADVSNSGSGSTIYGIDSINGMVNFNGKTTVTSKAPNGTAYAVYISSDPGTPLAQTNFYSDTKFNVEGKEVSAAISPSGNSSVINLYGKNTEITVKSNTAALGTQVQYGAFLNYDNPEGNFTINTNSEDGTAIPVVNTTYGGEDTKQFGRININANTINLNADGYNAFGIQSNVADPVTLNLPENGTTITANSVNLNVQSPVQAIGVYAVNTHTDGELVPTSFVKVDNLKATVNSSGGVAYGIFVSNEGDVTITNGTIQTNGAAQDVALLVQSGSVLNLNGKIELDATVAMMGDATINSSSDLTVTSGTVNPFVGNFNMKGGSLVLSPQNDYFSGNVNLFGGTLDLTNLQEEQIQSGLTIVEGGALKIKTAQLFSSPLSEEGTEISAEMKKLDDTVLKINKGSLVFIDPVYNLAYSDSIAKLYPNATLVFSGKLIDVFGSFQNLKVDSWSSSPSRDSQKATSGVIYTKATLEADSSLRDTLTIGNEPASEHGDVIRANVGVKDINFTDNYKKVNINGGLSLTLVGENPAAPVLTGKSLQSLEIGSNSSDSNGSLILGSSGVDSGGFISIPVTVHPNGNVDALNGTFSLENVKNLGKINISGGSDIHIAKLVSGNDSFIAVGNENNTGHLTVSEFELKGALFVDPSWESGKKSSEVAITLSNSMLEGQVVVGRNSKLSIGTNNQDNLENALSTINRSVSKNDLLAVAYLNSPLKLQNQGSLVVDGNLTVYPKNVKAGVFVGKNSALILNADENQAIFSGSSQDTFKTSENALLLVDNAKANSQLLVTDGFGAIEVDPSTELLTTNRLLVARKIKESDGQFVLGINPLRSDTTTLMPTAVQLSLNGHNGIGSKRLDALFDRRNGLSDQQVSEEINKIALMGTAGAAPTVAVNAFNMIGNSLDKHFYFQNGNEHPESGNEIWIDINSNFSRAASYSAGLTEYGYKSDLYGLNLGFDRTFDKQTTLGVAASFGGGSAKGRNIGSGTKNDVDYWAFSIYGKKASTYVNVLAKAGYLQTSNEIKQSGFKGKSKIKVLYAGLKVYKDFSLNDIISVTPYAGINYLHLQQDSFRAGGFDYKFKNANIVQMPVGVSFNGKFNTDSGWRIQPFGDFYITPSFGQKHIKNEVSLVGSGVSDSFNARFINNSMSNADFGLKMFKGPHSLNVSYGIGMSNHSRFDQSLNATYRYTF